MSTVYTITEEYTSEDNEVKLVKRTVEEKEIQPDLHIVKTLADIYKIGGVVYGMDLIKDV